MGRFSPCSRSSQSGRTLTPRPAEDSRSNSVAAAINELGAAAQEIARNAADASHQASSARTLAEDGSQVVERTISAMVETCQSSCAFLIR